MAAVLAGDRLAAHELTENIRSEGTSRVVAAPVLRLRRVDARRRQVVPLSLIVSPSVWASAAAQSDAVSAERDKPTRSRGDDPIYIRRLGGCVMAIRETRATIGSPVTTSPRALAGIAARNVRAAAGHRFLHPRPGHPFGYRREDHRGEKANAADARAATSGASGL